MSEDQPQVVQPQVVQPQVVQPQVVQPHVQTKNAKTASDGNAAERIVCASPEVLAALSDYLERKITKLTVIPGREKADILVSFDEGKPIRIQVKNGTGGGRGWSFDRRSLDKYTETYQELLKRVCLKAGGERPEVASDPGLLSKLLLGENEDQKPDYFMHVTIKDKKVRSLSICPADLFLKALQKRSYEKLIPKITCVHLSDLIYLQRKGGGTKDNAPNHIQAKLKSMPKMIMCVLLHDDQTTPPPQEQTP